MAGLSQRSGEPTVTADADVGGLLYGAVVSGAALAAISAHADATTRVAVSTLTVVIVYWLAHVYIDELSDQLNGDTRTLPRRLAESLRTELGVLFGGLPTVAVYILCALSGASTSVAAYVALTFLVGMLFTVGLVGARRAGLSGVKVLLEALAAGCFGVLIVVMKASLH